MIPIWMWDQSLLLHTHHWWRYELGILVRKPPWANKTGTRANKTEIELTKLSFVSLCRKKYHQKWADNFEILDLGPHRGDSDDARKLEESRPISANGTQKTWFHRQTTLFLQRPSYSNYFLMVLAWRFFWDLLDISLVIDSVDALSDFLMIFYHVRGLWWQQNMSWPKIQLSGIIIIGRKDCKNLQKIPKITQIH